MSLQLAAKHLASKGRGPDTELIHMTKGEIAGLQQLAKAHGGSLTINPHTGLPEAGFLSSILPTLVGAGVGLMTMNPWAGAAAGAAVGGLSNKENPLMGAVMGGLGGYGGAGLLGGLAETGASAVAPEALAAANASPDKMGAIMEAANQASMAGAQAPTGLEALQAGAQNTMNNPMGLVNTLGGPMGAAKTAAMAAAPLSMMSPETPWSAGAADEGTLPQYAYTARRTGEVYRPGESTRERNYFTYPLYTRMAEGGITSLSAGGFDFTQGGAPTYDENRVRSFAGGGGLEEGGFVIPADVVSALGNGSSSAGLEHLSNKLGAKPIQGPGDGMSDSIKTSIGGKKPAAVARDEAYVEPRQVAKAGGARKLYDMMDRVRSKAHGKTTQQRKVNPNALV